MNSQSSPINVFNFNFNQNTLIEASAGTGKTFTIVILYLRLLLGLVNINHVSSKLSIEKILIVTFTQTAKEEIKDRIKKYIHDLKIACIEKNTKIFILQKIMKEIKNFKKAIMILSQAEKKIDLAAIYTIHGFCHKILKTHYFYSKLLIHDHFIENNYKIYLKATNIFWKKHCHLLPYEISKIIYQEWLNEEKLLKIIYPLFKFSSIKLNTNILKNTNIILFHKNLIIKIKKFKILWLKNIIQINNFFHNLKINLYIYNKTNLNRWINIINKWSNNSTENYIVPSVLNYFNYITIKTNILNKNEKIPIFFKKIQYFLKINFSIKEIIIVNALQKIPEIIQKEKNKKLFYEHNDLIIFLNKFLKNKNIINNIQKQYPIAFIDEFQDTNLEQYKIFKTIYHQSKKSNLVIIGDPKQAIYSFQGADIFAYIKAKNETKKHYYLTTNFRSSKNMVLSVNMLFSRMNNPFIFNQILFQPLLSNTENQNINFTINGLLQPALNLVIEPTINKKKYPYWTARQCAVNIFNWINYSKTNLSNIQIHKKIHKVTEEDIVILVRNKNESKIIQLELDKININSIYISNKNCIYDIPEAIEILYILISLLDLRNEQAFINAFSTSIMQKTIQEIKNVQYIHKYRSIWIKKFYIYLSIWNKNGIYAMLKKITEEQKTSLTQKCLKKTKSTINNILHIGELLQTKEIENVDKYNLIQWFKKKIKNKKEIISKEEILRHHNIKNAIKIINIHASKGLEFFIVWIPFAINYIKSQYPIYHDQNHNLIYDLKNKNNSIKNAEKERIAEDIRLLYVAITRSIVHCCIGIETSKIKIKKNTNTTDIHCSAIGYILQLGKKLNKQQFDTIINNLKKETWIKITTKEQYLQKQYKNNHININNHIPEKKYNINKIWTITNYTQLKKENEIILNTKNQNIIDIKFKKNKILKNDLYNNHNFIKGSLSGQLLHNILKKTNFSENMQSETICKQLKKYNFNINLEPLLSSWIYNIFHTILDNKNFSLSHLKKNEYIKELEFLLPIQKTLNSSQLNYITKKNDPISIASPNLTFNNKKGMINGFIDLIFYLNKKYYILDYKSNWLGENNKYYSSLNIKNEMIKHRYDLQYQIYSIALHRYLKQRIKNYTFKNYFGGIFYFFIRAADGSNKNNGIFYQAIPKNLIQKLNQII
ncbi:RecBCD enzyme subunit RecB [Buchnera aphidicola (Eriosoma grossulariae)]|uniref:exodeoxyribonuclease V subunit beta n=1 Tax=Buchnera aphidicola TaxID=9 RepID=UPI003463FAE8